MRGSSSNRSLSDEGEVLLSSRRQLPTLHRQTLRSSKTNPSHHLTNTKKQTKSVLRSMKRVFLMCICGKDDSPKSPSLTSDEVMEKVREKEALLEEWSEDEEMGRGSASYPTYARDIFEFTREKEEKKKKTMGVGEKVEGMVKRAAYVPRHAASSFLRTATSPSIRRANEVL